MKQKFREDEQQQQEKMWKMYTLTATKYCSDKWKNIYINENMHLCHGSGNLILLICQISQNWFVDSKKS